MLATGLIWGLAPLAVRLLGLTEEAAGPIRGLAVLALLAAFRMPAAVLLERRLDYRTLTIADLMEIGTYYVVGISMAMTGSGVWSLVAGALLSKVVSVGLLWKMAKWFPRLRWRWDEAKALFRAGLPIQGVSLSITLRDASMPIIVTPWSGVVGVGYLSWAGTVAFLPLQLVSLTGKVLFPSLARLQDDAERFALATEQAINRVVMLLFPAILFLMATADPLVSLVYGKTWVPAIPALYLYGVAAAAGGLSNLCIHVLYSLGRSAEVFWLNVMWAALVWCLSLLFVPWWGFSGFAAASACVAGLSMSVLWLLRRAVPLRLSRAVVVPLFSSAITAALLYAACQLFVRDLFGLALSGALAFLLHLLLAGWLAGPLWRATVLGDLRTALGARL
jgi:O-antigen/teichoic acid export membrane protein